MRKPAWSTGAVATLLALVDALQDRYGISRIPFVPYADVLGFVPLPGSLLLTLVAITFSTRLYAGAAEVMKGGFHRRPCARS